METDKPPGVPSEIVAGHLRVDFADGTWAEVEIPKASWRLLHQQRELPGLTWGFEEWPNLGEQWYGFAFHPLDLLDNRAAFRITHHHSGQREAADG